MSKIKITMNGKEQEVLTNLMLSELVNTVNIKSKMFAVELNNEIIQKENYTKTILKEGDYVEIVTFFGGG